MAEYAEAIPYGPEEIEINNATKLFFPQLINASILSQ
jgi:hypothetical protein